MDNQDLCHKMVDRSSPTENKTKTKTKRFDFILNSENFDHFASRPAEMSLKFPFFDRRISAEIGTTTNVDLIVEISDQVDFATII
jgi:hypothetical protein